MRRDSPLCLLPLAFCAKCMLRSQHTYLNDGAHAFICPDAHDLAVATMKDGERSATHPQPLWAARINPALLGALVSSLQSSNQAGTADELAPASQKPTSKLWISHYLQAVGSGGRLQKSLLCSRQYPGHHRLQRRGQHETIAKPPDFCDPALFSLSGLSTPVQTYSTL